MSQSPRTELAGLFFQEVESYLPEIDRGLSVLMAAPSDLNTLNEIFRLFHNIKGAASQVSFHSLSKAAAIVEATMTDILENGVSLTTEDLSFFQNTIDRIRSFSTSPEKIPEDEVMVFADTLEAYRRLLEQTGKDLSANLHPDIQEHLEQSLVAGPSLSEDIAENGATPFLNTHQQSIESLRSILPLLQELTAGSLINHQDPRITRTIFGTLSQAVTTLADCSMKAGLPQQQKLLENLVSLLDKLHATPALMTGETLSMLHEFLFFLDFVFSCPPSDGEIVISRVDEKLQYIQELLITEQLHRQDMPLPPVFPQEEYADDDLSELDSLTNELFFEDEPLAQTGDDIDFELPSAAIDQHEVSAEHLELIAIFQEECEEHLVVINTSLNFLENEIREEQSLSPEVQETLAGMRRAVHTLKGAAAMTGFEHLATCAHSLEDLLDWLFDEAKTVNPEDIRIIASAIDAIETLAQNPDGADSTLPENVTATIKNHLILRSTPAVSSAADTLHTSLPVAEDVAQETPSDPIPPVLPLEPAEKPQETATLPSDTGNIRVKLEDLDELVSIEGELVVSRGSMEKMLEELTLSLTELNTVREKLRKKSQELESGFEAQSLYGFGPKPLPGQLPLLEADDTGLAEFDPIELDRYSELNLIIRSLNEISIDVNAIHTEMSFLSGNLRGQITRQQLAMGVMQEKLMRIRMTPLSSISRVLFRTVRQTAQRLNKNVQLSITGEEVFMDRYIWSKIIDPLMHILRNCVDHGIEPAALRTVLGKPANGKIMLTAEQRGRFVTVRISDDGAGIDVVKLRQKLLAEHLITTSKEVSDEELLPFLFRTSLSTRDDISPISGRGVGLDVVLKNVQGLRGTVQVKNHPGQGVTFELSIPITLSVNRAILVSVASRQFAVPLQDIVEVHRFLPAEIHHGDTLHVHWKDQLIPATHLATEINLQPTKTEAAETDSSQLALVFNTGMEHMALIVDRITEQREIIIKDLGTHLTYVQGVSGVTLTGDGALIPILNLLELVSGDQPTIARVEQVETVPAQHNPLKVLIVDDSISVRHSISRLVESQSWQPYQAFDGIDALEKLETLTPDVIILDIEMPRMNGYEFMNTLRNDEDRAAIPVIMLTSRTSEKHQRKAEELGVDHYLTKPYQEETFIQLLESLKQTH